MNLTELNDAEEKTKSMTSLASGKKFFRVCMKRDCMKACGSSKVHETPSHSLRQHIAGMSVRNVSINRYINFQTNEAHASTRDKYRLIESFGIYLILNWYDLTKIPQPIYANI